mgnify:CR=1 FL=1
MEDILLTDFDEFLDGHGVTLPYLLNKLGERNTACMQMCLSHILIQKKREIS